MTDAERQQTSYLVCSTCGKPKADAKKRIDHGLSAGVHCDPCWYDMIAKCRQRSW